MIFLQEQLEPASQDLFHTAGQSSSSIELTATINVRRSDAVKI